MTEEWFREAYPRAWATRGHAAFMTPERLAREMAGLERIFAEHGIAPGALVGDIPCGYGRISRPLAERGYRVVGLDLAEDQLLAAAEGRPRGLALVRADFRRMPLRAGVLDAALTLDYSLGYTERDETDREVLAQVRDLLRPGGIHVLDMLHREGVLATFRPSAFHFHDGATYHLGVEIDERRGRLIQRFTWDTGSMTQDIRLYTAAELRRLLESAGFEIATVHGGYKLEAFSPASPRFVAVSRRPR